MIIVLLKTSGEKKYSLWCIQKYFGNNICHEVFEYTFCIFFFPEVFGTLIPNTFKKIVDASVIFVFLETDSNDVVDNSSVTMKRLTRGKNIPVKMENVLKKNVEIDTLKKIENNSLW